MASFWIGKDEVQDLCIPQTLPGLQLPEDMADLFSDGALRFQEADSQNVLKDL